MTDPITTVTMPLSTSTEYREDDYVSTAVVEAVAEADGCSPLEMSPPLYSAIDPDALDQLFAASGASADPELRFDDSWTPTELSFTYAGYGVTVTSTSDGGVSVSLLEK
ncbi:hypothetical protein OB955_07515 [Halobacteria archaeon AArc-m2/3/4]|uniref:Halobacterial output domain-containing protein n=1 Tax=Natronoglomus mannanivorans TaxID=2979990 RepID=A0AAP3E1C0_9EURY|nr:hypothetical protein [Halobacteria archaeon AArc-xg1-1]MCU4972586.1 hypothetical protein [Halobacteria archaeon AArc-m2/3/4]